MEKAIEVTATEMTQLVAETHQILWEEAICIVLYLWIIEFHRLLIQ